uniref:Chromatin-modifying protein 1a n=1 Tax=Arcella intermedia TaxID=1963864 RepID=A0A6B2LJI1_9EUKA
MRLTARQLVLQSKRSEKQAKKEKLKLKRAIEQGNTEGARIYAQNAIRQKNQSLNYLRLSSRVDAVSARVETAYKMKQVTRSMANIVKAMEKSMQDMNLEKITEVMDKFERQFEDMDVQSEYVENTINQTTALTTPQGQVDDLIQEVATVHGLELTEQLGRIVPSKALPEVEQKAAVEQDELSQRLAKLKQ